MFNNNNIIHLILSLFSLLFSSELGSCYDSMELHAKTNFHNITATVDDNDSIRKLDGYDHFIRFHSYNLRQKSNNITAF